MTATGPELFARVQELADEIAHAVRGIPMGASGTYSAGLETGLWIAFEHPEAAEALRRYYGERLALVARVTGIMPSGPTQARQGAVDYIVNGDHP